MPEMSELLRERAAERAEQMAGMDQSFEAKKARALEGLDRLLQPQVSAIRLLGPPLPQMAETHRGLLRDRSSDMAAAYCRFCSPPPKVYKCPICDSETTDRWRMKLHNGVNPKYCQDRGAKKARKWASRA